jgi:hypothetical protein
MFTNFSHQRNANENYFEFHLAHTEAAMKKQKQYLLVRLLGEFIQYLWELKLLQVLRKSVWRFPKKFPIDFPYDVATPVFGRRYHKNQSELSTETSAQPY